MEMHGYMYTHINNTYIHIRASLLYLCVSLSRYVQDDLIGTKGTVDQCLKDDPETIVTVASVLYKEGKFEEVREHIVNRCTWM